MNHTVLWTPEAYQSLEHIWESANDRELVAHAIDEILSALRIDAQDTGESREDGLRVFFAAPLGVYFWANARTTDVIVVDVWIYPSKAL